ncbi:sigma-70 family RNA polymerase sigma factor [Demequina zhanjiangensis]|uniref:Sigma-70 family RNA polymerase sigma factor n=1 Tax=Demequina zhanjiangensis TaxID=3051659 RepID=A0ABT8G2K4_9MICO|nr:sigma-70 family RNA polymerase sigma factor [Demequina sp. SYSU T00b26]MDN4473386.1 sigma-70 family RNA polymerase sigma factor [Demequina sp. SYSU T00b26]
MSWSAVLDQLVRERGASLYGYAYVLTGDRAEAEDLLHDALVRTFRRGRRATELNAAHAYVKRAITTAFIDGKRRERVRPARSADDVNDLVQAPPGASFPDATTHANAALDLRAALLLLPPRERACVVLRHLEDWPVGRISSELGIAEGTVKRYVSDGLGRLREARPDLEPGAEMRETTPLITRPGGRS